MNNAFVDDEIVAAYLLHQKYCGDELRKQMEDCGISPEVAALSLFELKERLSDFIA